MPQALVGDGHLRHVVVSASEQRAEQCVPIVHGLGSVGIEGFNLDEEVVQKDPADPQAIADRLNARTACAKLGT
jgi:hypothetical protein